MAKFKMIVIFKSVLKLTQKFVQFVSSCKNPNQCLAVAWQCSALFKAQVKAYLGVFRVTVNSPSVTRIHLLAIFYFEVFIYSAAEECYTVQFLQLMLTITCTHYDCMRIALSLRVHHRAQRLFIFRCVGAQ